MRLACFRDDQGEASLYVGSDAGFVELDALADALNADDLRWLSDAAELFRRGPATVDRLAGADLRATPASDSERRGEPAAPLRPGKIVCVGLNHSEHIDQSRLKRPERIVLSAKFPPCVTAPTDSVILRSQITSCLDYEGELGTVMSRRASRVAARDAMSHVGGYTIINDISARDLQGAEPQWLRAKSLDSFAPVGPYVVDPRSAGPVEQMRIQTLVNGELRQDASCAAMIVGVPDLIEYVTEAITLEPGDLIATGTPAGVAAEGDPPVFLAHGDVVEVEITGLGRLRNQVQAR